MSVVEQRVVRQSRRQRRRLLMQQFNIFHLHRDTAGIVKSGCGVSPDALNSLPASWCNCTWPWSHLVLQLILLLNFQVNGWMFFTNGQLVRYDMKQLAWRQTHSTQVFKCSNSARSLMSSLLVVRLLCLQAAIKTGVSCESFTVLLTSRVTHSNDLLSARP